jgi:hypothetical protein
MQDESTLRQKAREVIQSGTLPVHRPQRMWGGRGSGAACAICGQRLEPDQFEFELQFASNGEERPGANLCHVHIRCFAAWEFEREDMAASGGEGLRTASDRDTIADRERDRTQGRGTV